MSNSRLLTCNPMLSSNLKLVYAPSLSFLWPVILRKRTRLTSAPILSKMFLHLPPPFHVPSFTRLPRFLWSWNVIMWHVSMTLWVCHYSLSHVWLFDSMDCSPQGSSVHGILQARIVEWVATSFSRGSSWPRDQTWVSCIAGRFFTASATREALGMSLGRGPTSL